MALGWEKDALLPLAFAHQAPAAQAQRPPVL